MRDGGESHEAFEILLTDGEEVGDGDRRNDDPHQGVIPRSKQFAVHREDLHQHSEEHKGGATFRNDAEETSHHGGGALIGVGRPKVEGNQRNLEAHSGQEEGQTEQRQRERATAAEAHEVEVERAERAVEERDAVEHQRCGEEGEKNELRTGFGALIAQFVVGHQGSHGN